MKKYLFMVVALAAMAFTTQKASAQIGLQLTSSVSSIDLGTVEVNSEVPVGFLIGMVDTGSYIPPYIVNIRIQLNPSPKLELKDIFTVPTGATTFEVGAAIEPIEIGVLGGEALKVSVEVPIPLLPNITLEKEIPITGTVIP
ncbi:MAG TPA: hypothetical protein K8W04_03755 [Bacteroides reticulotermitis]|nr:hypothetical protein [Bacteroides reticulotermitis]